MKKILLSCIALLGLGFAAVAEEVELNANDATNFVGEFTDEVAPEGNKNGEAAHWQPLESFEIGLFEFNLSIGEGKTEPAYYYAMSTNTNQQSNIRVYRNNVMTISAPANTVITAISATGTKVAAAQLDACVSGLGTGTIVINNTSGENMRFNTITLTTEGGSVPGKNPAGLAWSETEITVEKGAAFTAPTFSKATTAEVTFTSDNEEVATVNAQGVISLAGAEGVAVITASAEENADYLAGRASCTIKVVSYRVYAPATTFEDGKNYLIVAIRDGEAHYAYPLGADKSYGYLSAGTSENVNEIRVSTAYDDTFLFKSNGRGEYNISDCYGRYLIQQGTYKSFNLTEEAPATGWTVEANADGTYNIAMNGYFWQWGQSTYTTFGVYQDLQENAVLPRLYAELVTGIEAVEAEADVNAPVVYYNLQGVRVANPQAGIFVRVQGNKATKVLVK